MQVVVVEQEYLIHQVRVHLFQLPLEQVEQVVVEQVVVILHQVELRV